VYRPMDDSNHQAVTTDVLQRANQLVDEKM
jgi:hypothetical protein